MSMDIGRATPLTKSKKVKREIGSASCIHSKKLTHDEVDRVCNRTFSFEDDGDDVFQQLPVELNPNTSLYSSGACSFVLGHIIVGSL